MEWNWLDQHKVQSVQSSHTLHTGRILTGLGPWLWSSTSRFPFRGGNSSSECYLYLFMLIKPCCALSVLQSKNTHTHILTIPAEYQLIQFGSLPKSWYDIDILWCDALLPACQGSPESQLWKFHPQESVVWRSNQLLLLLLQRTIWNNPQWQEMEFQSERATFSNVQTCSARDPRNSSDPKVYFCCLPFAALQRKALDTTTAFQQCKACRTRKQCNVMNSDNAGVLSLWAKPLLGKKPPMPSSWTVGGHNGRRTHLDRKEMGTLWGLWGL